MKKDIHPKYYPEAKVICACGRTWTTGSTKPEIRTEMCSVCHPFYTGEQRIVDTAGQVERFERRLGIKREFDAKEEVRRRKRAARRAREIVSEVPEEPEAAAGGSEAPTAEASAAQSKGPASEAEASESQGVEA